MLEVTPLAGEAEVAEVGVLARGLGRRVLVLGGALALNLALPGLFWGDLELALLGVVLGQVTQVVGLVLVEVEEVVGAAVLVLEILGQIIHCPRSS